MDHADMQRRGFGDVGKARRRSGLCTRSRRGVNSRKPERQLERTIAREPIVPLPPSGDPPLASPGSTWEALLGLSRVSSDFLSDASGGAGRPHRKRKASEPRATRNRRVSSWPCARSSSFGLVVRHGNQRQTRSQDAVRTAGPTLMIRWQDTCGGSPSRHQGCPGGPEIPSDRGSEPWRRAASRPAGDRRDTLRAPCPTVCVALRLQFGVRRDDQGMGVDLVPSRTEATHR